MRSRQSQHFLVLDPGRWPPDEAEEIFVLRALRDLGALRFGDDGQASIDESVLWSLQRGELRAVVLDSYGRTHDLERHRWKTESGVAILLTGRASVQSGSIRGTFPFLIEGYVYFPRTALADVKDDSSPVEPPTTVPAAEWHPLPDQTLIDWATSKPVVELAETRIRNGGDRVTARRLASELSSMASEAGRDFSDESIHRSRRKRKAQKGTVLP